MSAVAPDTIRRQDLGLPYPFREPSDALEANICKAFAYALEIDRVGADDEFFDLGGDSLKAEAVAMSIASVATREIRVSWLASHGTPAKIAAILSKPFGTIGEDGTPPPVFSVHGRLGFMLPRPEMTDSLGPGQRLHMFELPGLHKREETPRRIEDIAGIYVAELNAAYPEGPVLLAGFCAGSLIALEMARQLQAQGRVFEQFVLGDPHIPAATVKSMGLVMDGAGWLPGAGAKARLKWSARKAALTLALGRPTDGSLERDFADERLRRVRERFYRIYMLLWKADVAIRSKKNKVQHLDKSTHAQARLLAAYRHYRPQKYTGPISIVVSAERKTMIPVWAHLMPQAEFHVLDAEHGKAVAFAAGLFGEKAANTLTVRTMSTESR